MEAKELRLNNWVMYGNTYPIVKGKFFEIDCLDIMKAETLEPIPLSEEWLLKAGFNHAILTTSQRFYTSEFNIRIFNKSKKLSVSFEGIKLEHIKHVHQLQNLFYALTGEELIFND